MIGKLTWTFGGKEITVIMADDETFSVSGPELSPKLAKLIVANLTMDYEDVPKGPAEGWPERNFLRAMAKELKGTVVLPPLPDNGDEEIIY